MKRAFTIVELLIVVVVIAILAAITIIAYNGITQRAQAAKIDSNFSTATKKILEAITLDGVSPETDTIGSITDNLADDFDGVKSSNLYVNEVRYQGSGTFKYLYLRGGGNGFEKTFCLVRESDDKKSITIASDVYPSPRTFQYDALSDGVRLCGVTTPIVNTSGPCEYLFVLHEKERFSDQDGFAIVYTGTANGSTPELCDSYRRNALFYK